MAFNNYAEKYSSLVDERFTEAAKTNSLINNNYDFQGVNVVNIYTIGTKALSDYDMTAGLARFGSPAELDNSVQTLTLSQDKAFTFTVDARVAADTNGAVAAGECLSRELNEVVIPTVDKYRIQKLAAGAGNASTVTSVQITASNAFSAFLDGVNTLTNNSVPEGGRVALISPNFYKCILTDSSFIKSTDAAQGKLINGQVGTLAGIRTVLLPDSYMPTKSYTVDTTTTTYRAEFLITHPSAMVSPVKLAEYRTHKDPPGLSGWLLEGRLYYDAFVLNNKKGAIYLHVGSTTVS
ncbi:MAG: N4-gp56 family major capsid protein [Abditibacteriota bacterium]|nr:N4-gp56 family major capsid protein [Abditibacteriota bacterium]